MRQLEPIKIAWEGKEYVIPDDRVMLAIAKVEEIVTLPELGDMLETGKVQFSRVAMAYGAILRYAGAQITDRDVHAGLFNRPGKPAETLATVSILLALLLPPDFVNLGGKAPPAGNAPSAAAPNGSGSRRKRTARPSVPAGLVPPSSGI